MIKSNNVLEATITELQTRFPNGLPVEEATIETFSRMQGQQDVIRYLLEVVERTTIANKKRK